MSSRRNDESVPQTATAILDGIVNWLDRCIHKYFRGYWDYEVTMNVIAAFRRTINELIDETEHFLTEHEKVRPRGKT